MRNISLLAELENNFEYNPQDLTHPCMGLIVLGNSKLAVDNKISSSRGDLWAVSIRKTVLPGMAIPMLKIRRPNGRLIFNMEIAIRR